MYKEISNEKIVQFLNKCLYISLFLILLLLGMISLFVTAKMSNKYFIDTETIEFIKDNLIINFFCIGLLYIGILIYIRLIKNISEKIVLYSILIILFTISAIWVIVVGEKVPIRADQEIIFNIANNFINNNFTDLYKFNYLGMFPYQIGITLIFEIFIKIFSDSAILAIRFLNIICIITFV